MICRNSYICLQTKKESFKETLLLFTPLQFQRAKPCFTLSRSSAALALLKRSSVPTK